MAKDKAEAETADLAAQLEAQKQANAELAARLDRLAALVEANGKHPISVAEVDRAINPTIRDPNAALPRHPGLDVPYFDDLRPTGRR